MEPDRAALLCAVDGTVNIPHRALLSRETLIKSIHAPLKDGSSRCGIDGKPFISVSLEEVQNDEDNIRQTIRFYEKGDE